MPPFPQRLSPHLFALLLLLLLVISLAVSQIVVSQECADAHAANTACYQDLHPGQELTQELLALMYEIDVCNCFSSSNIGPVCLGQSSELDPLLFELTNICQDQSCVERVTIEQHLNNDKDENGVTLYTFPSDRCEYIQENLSPGTDSTCFAFMKYYTILAHQYRAVAVPEAGCQSLSDCDESVNRLFECFTLHSDADGTDKSRSCACVQRHLNEFHAGRICYWPEQQPVEKMEPEFELFFNCSLDGTLSERIAVHDYGFFERDAYTEISLSHSCHHSAVVGVEAVDELPEFRVACVDDETDGLLIISVIVNVSGAASGYTTSVLFNSTNYVSRRANLQATWLNDHAVIYPQETKIYKVELIDSVWVEKVLFEHSDTITQFFGVSSPPSSPPSTGLFAKSAGNRSAFVVLDADDAIIHLVDVGALFSGSIVYYPRTNSYHVFAFRNKSLQVHHHVVAVSSLVEPTKDTYPLVTELSPVADEGEDGERKIGSPPALVLVGDFVYGILHLRYEFKSVLIEDPPPPGTAIGVFDYLIAFSYSLNPPSNDTNLYQPFDLPPHEIFEPHYMLGRSPFMSFDGTSIHLLYRQDLQNELISDETSEEVFAAKYRVSNGVWSKAIRLYLGSETRTLHTSIATTQSRYMGTLYTTYGLSSDGLQFSAFGDAVCANDNCAQLCDSQMYPRQCVCPPALVDLQAECNDGNALVVVNVETTTTDVSIELDAMVMKKGGIVSNHLELTGSILIVEGDLLLSGTGSFQPVMSQISVQGDFTSSIDAEFHLNVETLSEPLLVGGCVNLAGKNYITIPASQQNVTTTFDIAVFHESCDHVNQTWAVAPDSESPLCGDVTQEYRGSTLSVVFVPHECQYTSTVTGVVEEPASPGLIIGIVVAVAVVAVLVAGVLYFSPAVRNKVLPFREKAKHSFQLEAPK